MGQVNVSLVAPPDSLNNHRAQQTVAPTTRKCIITDRQVINPDKACNHSTNMNHDLHQPGPQCVHSLSKGHSLAKPGPTGGDNIHSSTRPPFPTIAGASGIQHGRKPKIHTFSGLRKASHRPGTEIHIEGAIGYERDARRLEVIRHSGVN